MPVHKGKDQEGPYFQWGQSGKKYRYTPGNESSKEEAKRKARRQGQAIHASKRASVSRDSYLRKLAMDDVLAVITSGSQAFPLIEERLQGKPIFAGFEETSLGLPGEMSTPPNPRRRRVDEEEKKRGKKRQGGKIVMKALKLGTYDIPSTALNLNEEPEFEEGSGNAERETDSNIRDAWDRIDTDDLGSTSNSPTPSLKSASHGSIGGDPVMSLPSEGKDQDGDERAAKTLKDQLDTAPGVSTPTSGVLGTNKVSSLIADMRMRAESKEIPAEQPDARGEKKRRRISGEQDKQSVSEIWNSHRSMKTRQDVADFGPDSLDTKP